MRGLWRSRLWLGACSVAFGLVSCRFKPMPPPVEPTPSGQVSAGARFPADWVGRWEGILQVFPASGPQHSVRMRLDVEPLSGPVYRWRIRYAEGEAGQDRDYRLEVTDVETGAFVIDEQNGIVLPGRLVGGAMVQRFRVKGSDLLAVYRRDGAALRFTLFASGVEGSDAGRSVLAFPVAARQEAVLSRASADRK